MIRTRVCGEGWGSDEEGPVGAAIVFVGREVEVEMEVQFWGRRSVRLFVVV